jgi:hypothetical protein
MRVDDISTDPPGANFHDLAASFGLRSCWSWPLRSSRGRLVGTYALYNLPLTATEPSKHESFALLVHTAALLIERHLEFKQRERADNALLESRRQFHFSEEQLKLAVDVAKVMPEVILLKEWAYAGFTFTLISAFIAHVASKDGPKGFMPPVIMGILLAVSYFTSHPML